LDIGRGKEMDRLAFPQNDVEFLQLEIY